MDDDLVRRRLERFNPFDQTLADDLPSVFEEARTHFPVVHSSELGGFWLVTPHEEVSTVLRDTETFSSRYGVNITRSEKRAKMPPMDLDPPLQREFRRLLNPYLSPSTLAPYRESIAGIADRLIARFLDAGHCEVIEDFAKPFAAAVLAQIILNLDDEPRILEVQEWVDMVSVGNDQGWINLRPFVVELLARRSTEPSRNDVISAVLEGTIDGRRLTPDERLGVIMVLLLGGLHTTTSAIGSIVHRMTQDPVLERWVADPDNLRLGVDEFLRLDSPVSAMARRATRDVDLGGQAIPAGDWLLVAFASANRDEREFEHPERLDFHRATNRHVAFGLGPHRCIGSHLARLQIAVGFERLLDTIEEVRLADGATVHYVTGVSRSPAAVPITFRRRSHESKEPAPAAAGQ